MFTGIIENLGSVQEITLQENGNIDFLLTAPFVPELTLGQSVAHNGVCLTVTEIVKPKNGYKVTAVPETLNRSNLGLLKIGDEVNLERCLLANGRFDGHIVQGHVDTTVVCEEVIDKKGSWVFRFSHPRNPLFLTVEKGSVCVNGISLTVATSSNEDFTVAIIPYTYRNTNLKYVGKGTKLNVEFDILGKYLHKMSQNIT
jgi:riboflavin synthase